MTGDRISRHRTAIHRSELSRPIRLALRDGIIGIDDDVLDYGCGHGDDLERLGALGIACRGWDPAHRPDGERTPSHIVNVGYVINVIENPEERTQVLRDCWALAQSMLIVSARLQHELRGEVLSPYGDGWLTKTGTFQKYYDQRELSQWIDEVLGVQSVPAGPGVFYVFRDPGARETFVASRFRPTRTRRVVQPVFERYKELLEPLMEFLTARGRLPDDSEIEQAGEIRTQVGSVKRAFRIIAKATGPETWARIREERAQDLLVYLALAKFSRRPAFSKLPHGLRLDVRGLLSTYKRACAQADALLFSAGNRQTVDGACRASHVGKLTPSALYIHQSALESLEPVLRIYEGCARVVVGSVEGANVIKLHRDAPVVSYLQYPQFEDDPHPALQASLLVDLQSLRVKYREYSESENPPILHRKEEFVGPDHPLRETFANLTRQEEDLGLYSDPKWIGTRNGWLGALKAKQVMIRRHECLVISEGLEPHCPASSNESAENRHTPG